MLAVASEAAAERLPTKLYTAESGLANNRVKRIVQDSRGFLWFCTADGLSRFDGAQFTNYRLDDGLPAASINDVLESKDGVYWIATNSVGVVRFDLLAETRPPQNGVAHPRYTVFPVSRDPVANRVNALYADRAEALWAATDGGLFRLESGGQAFQPVALGVPGHSDIQVQVWALAEDRDGELWIATKFGLVRRSPDGQTTHYKIEPTLGDDFVIALLIDRDGMLWLGHRTGLVAVRPERLVATYGAGGSHLLLPVARRYTAVDGLTNSTVLGLQQASDGRLWMRTLGVGLTIFDGTTFQGYQIAADVSDRGTLTGSLSEDRDGNFWFGTPGDGAVKIAGHGWVTYGEADGIGDPAGAIFENQAGEVYATSRPWRISRFGRTGFTTVRPRLRDTIPDAGWRELSGVVHDRTSEWWVASREGLYRFPKLGRFEDLADARPIAIYTTRDGLANDDVTRIFEDARGDIWIASFVPMRAPVTRWERATGRFHLYAEEDGLRPFTSAVAFAQDGVGSLWIGFREGGIARYRDGRFTMLGSSEGLPDGTINGIYPDPAGRLWVSITQGGVGRIDNPNEDRPRVTVYNRAQGLTSDLVLSITGDLQGHIYAGHARGIDRLDPSTGRIKRYAAADGLMGAEFRSAVRDRSGALWFCTSTGLSRFVPGPEPPISPPPILISAVRVAGVEQPLSALGEPAVSLAQLDPSQNNVQVDFFGMDLRAGESLRYQYRLDATASEWSPPSAQRSVHFANLASGAYRVLVRAVDADGTPSPSPAIVSFEVLPPIWRRWWFLAAAGVILAAAVGGIAHTRAQRLKALHESEARFRTLAETASDAIVTIDEEGRIVLVNQAAESVFGYTRDEMTGAELTMLLPDPAHDGRAPAPYKPIVRRLAPLDAIELAGRHKSGRAIPLEISFGEFMRDGQRFFTGVARDITERKRAAEALRRSREERLAELERVRKRIATDLHDDIGSNLTRISLLSEVVQQRLGGVETSIVEPLSSIARLSRELVDSMSDIVWAINPNKDHLSDLSQRMRRFASDVFTARRIAFKFRTPGQEHDTTLGANVRRELFLIFKEAVNNAVRHSGCSEAQLDLSAETDVLVLRVIDNGRGFDVADKAAGHGLLSMRERTEGLGGTLEVRSARGQGTALTVRIPVTGQPLPMSAVEAPADLPTEICGDRAS